MSETLQLIKSPETASQVSAQLELTIKMLIILAGSQTIFGTWQSHAPLENFRNSILLLVACFYETQLLFFVKKVPMDENSFFIHITIGFWGHKPRRGATPH